MKRIVAALALVCALTAGYIYVSLNKSKEAAFFRVDDISKNKEMARADLDFRLPSLDGKTRSLQDFGDGVMLIAISGKCLSDADLKKIQKIKAERKLNFALIDSDPDADRPAIEKKWGGKKLDYLYDPVQLVSRSFSLDKFGAFAVVRADSAEIIDSGTLWPGHSCKIALSQEPVEDFVNAFLPAFKRACLNCHISGNALDIFQSVEDVAGWSAMSLKTMRLMRMPDGNDPYYTAMHRSRTWTNQDLRLIAQWLEAPPEPTAAMEQAFARAVERAEDTPDKDLGKPDLVFERATPLLIPADSGTHYEHFTISPRFEEDTLVQAIQLETNLNVVHHVNIFALPFELKKELAKEVSTSRRHKKFEMLMGKSAMRPIEVNVNGKLAPGFVTDEMILRTFSRRKGFYIWPENRAFLIPKGTYLAVELHINSSGKNENERTKINLFRRNSKHPYKLEKRFTLVPNEMTIPPGEKNFVVRSELVLDRTINLHKVTLHMHYRGRSAKFMAQMPGESTPRILGSIPYYQFKVPQKFRFSDLTLPKGTKIITEMTYDNSAENTANPDPTREVHRGSSTFKNEMHLPRFFYTEEES